MKNARFLLTRSLTGLYEKVNLFVLDTPKYQREVTKRLAAHQLHGNLTPGRISVGCPHLLRRSYHARLYGWAGVSLSLLPVMAHRGPPGDLRPPVLAPYPEAKP